MIWTLPHTHERIAHTNIKQKPEDVLPPFYCFAASAVLHTHLISTINTEHVSAVLFADYRTNNVHTAAIFLSALYCVGSQFVARKFTCFLAFHAVAVSAPSEISQSLLGCEQAVFSGLQMAYLYS